ncbi:MAG: carbohydrate kinase family protein [Mogibacterium sp.]|nr:carbohydrate kinase family protein [Mogibacterium sp.]
MKKYDVVCIGVAIMDSIIRGFDPEPISAAGFRAESGSLNVGGDAVNEAVALSKLGLRTAILCSLGKDPAGDVIASELTRYNVDVSNVLRPVDHPTPITTIFVGADGNRRSITNSAHRYNFHPEQYPQVFTDTRAIVMGSLFRAPFDDPAVIRSVAAAARAQGVMIFADTKLPNFRRLRLEDLADTLPIIDFLTPNEDEARFYTGKEDPGEMADVLLETGVRNVVIKLGSKGCYFKNRDFALHVPAFGIDAVDATGAGDNFMAGLVSELIRGGTVPDALRVASACGAICTTVVGACAGLESREQVRRFLADVGKASTI